MQGFGEFMGNLVQIITKGANNGPEAKSATQQLVNNQGGADPRGLVNVRLKQRAGWDLATCVVIGIENPVVPLKQPIESFPIAVKRDVKHGDPALSSIKLVEQGKVSFYSRNQQGVGVRDMETQLLQGADPIGISVEDIDSVHEGTMKAGGGLLADSVICLAHQNQEDCQCWLGGR